MVNILNDDFVIMYNNIIEILKQTSLIQENEHVQKALSKIRAWLITFVMENADYITAYIKKDGTSVVVVGNWFTVPKDDQGCIILSHWKNGKSSFRLTTNTKKILVNLDGQPATSVDAAWTPGDSYHMQQYKMSKKYSLDNTPLVVDKDLLDNPDFC